MKQGTLVISLDFELYWGVVGKKSLAEYKDSLLGVQTAIPAMLALFNRYGIHATWATVGFLFCHSRDELLDAIPATLPEYADESLSPYRHLEEIGTDKASDPFYFAPSLIALVANEPYQEIASHTFSHYYALAQGQNKQAFRADLDAARRVAAQHGYALKSLVFPRNQENADYLDVCQELGFVAYRGIPKSASYTASDDTNSISRRGMRLTDSYLNVLGHHTYALGDVHPTVPCNIAASRFLRPYNSRLKHLEEMRQRRILDDMTYSAQNGLVYHLWWHPENFGRDTIANLNFLELILAHFCKLHAKFGFQSQNMCETAEMVLRQK